MATFEALQQQVSKRLKDPNNTDVTVSDVSALINDAIRYWSRKQYKFNEFQETVTLTAGSPTLTLVTNTSPKNIFTQGGVTINYASSRWTVNRVNTSDYDDMNDEGRGIPFAYTYRNGGYELYYYPDRDYTAIVRGLKSYDKLVNNEDTNDFTDNAENLIIYEATARGFAEFKQDDRMEAYFTARAKDEHRVLTEENNRERASGRIYVEGL